jgi:hypothetical protein
VGIDDEVGIWDAGMREGTSSISTSGGSLSESETSSTRAFMVRIEIRAVEAFTVGGALGVKGFHCR